MAKNIYIILRCCITITSIGGAVEESKAADQEDVGSPPACFI
jgi:hypothetical protein